MRFLSLLLGTRGDLEIAIQLSNGLAARGHEVTIASSPFYAERVAEAGLGFEPIGDGALEELVGLFQELTLETDRSARVRRYAERWLRPQLAAAAGSLDALLASYDAGFNNLRLYGRSADARPMALITYDPPSDPGRYGREQPPAHVLEVVALDRELIDPAQEWPGQFRFSGFFKPYYTGTAPPSDQQQLLDRFMADGEAPVVLTMGSMTCSDPKVLHATVLEACRQVGRRLLAISSWSGLPYLEQDDTLTVQQAPYDLVFSAAACVIHHGGCGTVVSALRAGKPSVLLPQITSQATFAKLLESQNLIGGAFDTHSLEAGGLASALERCLGDSEVSQACTAWRERVLRQDGAAVASEMIERHAAQFS